MSYAAKYSFETPLSLPTFGKKVKEEEVSVQKKEKTDATTAEEEEEDDEEDVEDPVLVTFNAGIAGNIVHRRQRATAQFEDGTEEEMQVGLDSPSTIFELHSNIL
jgi:hypothetical protein